MKTIFLTDGETHVREALSLMVKHQTEFEIVGQASTPESTLAQVCQQPPDVILLDWNLPGLHHLRLIDALRQCCPQTIILATSVKPEQESNAIKSGVNAFLLKQLPPDQFIAALIAAVNQQKAQE